VKVDLSIVSHGQGFLVEKLLKDLARYQDSFDKIVITLNVPESDFDVDVLLQDKIVYVHNDTPAGFGANHNAAVALCESEIVCILNPDLRVESSPFDNLLETVSRQGVSLVGPRILSVDGKEEENVRPFITLPDIIEKVFSRTSSRSDTDYSTRTFCVPYPVDWVGGMFMMVRKDAFTAVGGFDEHFFLYYEDVDLCARFKKAGWIVMYDPRTNVIHDARRDSHTKMRYLKWHSASMLRYFLKHGFFGFK